MSAPARWIRGPAADAAVAWCWVPFALLAHGLESHTGPVRQLLAGVLVFSFLHQPLTLALVYASPQRFRLHRRLFLISPLVLLAAVMAGTHISLVLLAAVGGLWNAEHTLMQRYGVTRIYGRKGGDERGEMEKRMLVSWLVLALIWVAADRRTPGLVARVNLDQVNASAVSTLHRLSGPAQLALVPAVLVVALLTGRWLRAEVGAVDGNPAKRLYLLSTALLFLTILVDPVAGFVAYVGSHAVEYFAVVHSALGRRPERNVAALGRRPERNVAALGRRPERNVAALGRRPERNVAALGRRPERNVAALGRQVGPDDDTGALERVVARTGAVGFLAAYLAVVAVALLALDRWATPLQYTTLVLTLGGLHIFYDGFIWKLRRPSVARRLAVPVSA